MKQFRAKVKVSGTIINTIVFADNHMFALKLVKQQYGANNVVSPPVQI